MNRKIVITLVPILAVLAFAGCTKKEIEEAYTKQEEYIEAIVKSLTSSNPEATVDYLDGVVKVTVAEGEGEALDGNGAVSFYYAGHYLNGNSLTSDNFFFTNYDVYGKSMDWEVSDSSVFTVKTVNLSEDKLVEGLRTGIVGVKGGDECYVLFSGKHGFGKHRTGPVPGNSGLAYHLWIKSVAND